MKLLLVLAILLLSGCASSPSPATLTPTGTTTMGTTAAPSAPIAPPLPPPLVGHCDVQVASVGLVTGSVRNGSCALSTAIPADLTATRSLLMEVSWDNLQPSIVSMKSTIEFPGCPNSTQTPPTPCPELASNMSMVSPVRVVLDGDAYAKVQSGIAGFVNVYEGVAAQQTFTVTFSAFANEHVPANFTGLKP